MGFRDFTQNYRVFVVIFWIVSLLLFIAGLVLIIIFAVLYEKCENEEPIEIPGRTELNNGRVYYDINSKGFELFRENKKDSVLKGRIGLKIDNQYLEKVTIQKTDINTKINFNTKLPQYIFSNITLTVSSKKITKTNYQINCDRYDWTTDVKIDNSIQEFEDCFSLKDSYWYGGAESFLEQYWPINNQTHDPYEPYLSGLFGINSAVLERYWFNSKGVAIIIDQSVSLFVKMNKSDICFLATAKDPYPIKPVTNFGYYICSMEYDANDESYLKNFHLELLNRYFGKPVGIPDDLMFKSPIWSTWAIYKREINDSVVLGFAEDILKNNYTHSQLEIDDDWQTHYGDFEFNKKKFPDAADMIRKLKNMGFRTTLWMHPFANLESKTFQDNAFKNYWVRSPDGVRPAFTRWWCGEAAGLIDPTNPVAADWFVSELENMKRVYGLDSFKFDAGELEWLPKKYWLFNASSSPEEHSMRYLEMTARLGPMIEVRTACQVQHLPIFVRMIDKDSRWGFDNGLVSVLTTSLVMSILGYPYVLPDMIGGNAYYIYDETTGQWVEEIPDYELFIRWAQLTAFTPSMQFSIPPWYYENIAPVDINSICRKAVEIHETIVYPKLKKAAEQAVQFGEPIMRPMWWIDSTDHNNLIIYDQYFIGDDLLVAPVLHKAAIKRDVYLPKGNWKDGNNNNMYQGPIWLRDYPADIATIPYFNLL